MKAERGSQLAEWFVSTDKLQYDFDKDYYYLLLGVIYPTQDDRRDISPVNGMAYISGGAIFGDVIKSINYVDDDSNEGSMYDLNNGKVRLGNKFKGLLIDIVNKVFLLFGVTLEFKNADDELVSKIDGDTGAAMFGKGNTEFNEDGSGHLAAGNILWDAIGNLLISGRFESNKDGNRIVIAPEDRDIKMVDTDDRVLSSWSFNQNVASASGVAALRINEYSGTTLLNSSTLFPRGLYSSGSTGRSFNVDVGTKSGVGGISYVDSSSSIYSAFKVYANNLNGRMVISVENILREDDRAIFSGDIYADRAGYLKIKM